MAKATSKPEVIKNEDGIDSLLTQADETPIEVYGAKRHYQEWLVQINDGKAEQLKITRECVKITEEQAEILNQGVVEGGNAIAKMYFLKEK